MSKRKMNLPIQYEVQKSDFDSERFQKMRIYVMHSGLNLNNSNFGKSAIKKAQSSLANIPILAFVKKQDGTDEQDFGGHEFEIKITENGVDFVYLGRPIGIIPETNNYSFEEDEEGKNFVVVDGYVWKDYANSALDIIARDEVKKVSMEILVHDYKWEDDYIDILDYSYVGIAMLGEDVREAMIGAKAEIINYSKNAIASMLLELKETLKGGEGTLDNFEEKDDGVVEEETFEEEEEETKEENFEEEEKEEQEESEEESFSEKEVELMNEVASLKEEKQTLQSTIDQLQTQIAEYELGQKEAAVEALFQNFPDLEDSEEAQQLKTQAMEADLEEIEMKLFALRGKQLVFTAKDDDEEENKAQDWRKLIHDFTDQRDQNEPEWAPLVEKHKAGREDE